MDKQKKNRLSEFDFCDLKIINECDRRSSNGDSISQKILDGIAKQAIA